MTNKKVYKGLSVLFSTILLTVGLSSNYVSAEADMSEESSVQLIEEVEIKEDSLEDEYNGFLLGFEDMLDEEIVKYISRFDLFINDDSVIDTSLNLNLNDFENTYKVENYLLQLKEELTTGDQIDQENEDISDNSEIESDEDVYGNIKVDSIATKILEAWTNKKGLPAQSKSLTVIGD